MDIINGNEVNKSTSDYEKVLSEFYSAFNSQNLEKMKNNWAVELNPVMSNPLGGKKTGWADIEQVYQNIFTGPASVYVEFYDYTVHQSADMFSAAGRERGYFSIDDEKIELCIRTSRIYQYINGHWKQVHHHGSIDDPSLLSKYQQAVMQAISHQ